MATQSGIRYAHKLDARLADANLFAWFRPMFQLLFRHWLVTLGAGVATLVVAYVVATLPWLLFAPWWMIVLHGFVETLAVTLVVVAAYRVVVQRESAGTALTFNDWARTLICGVQIAVVWTVAACLVGGALLLVGSAVTALLPQLGSGSAVIVLIFIYAALAIPIAVFLLSPLWAILAVASALSTVHAVRSLDNGLGAVLSSLQLAFDQKWRVFWPSYVLGLLAIALYAVSVYLSIQFPALAGRIGLLVPIAFTAMGVAMTFVIERAYAPDLGLVLEDGEGPATAAPAPVAPRTGAAAPAAHRGTVAAAAAAPATAAEIAALIAEELRSNRTHRLVELVERGLAADAKFFAGHPDSTISLAKKIVQAERPDLALRLLQTYLKEHRGHRLHLTAALLVANVLVRDPARSADAARFLGQVKTLYPNEPMVDQLMKTAHKAIAESAASAAS